MKSNAKSVLKPRLDWTWTSAWLPHYEGFREHVVKINECTKNMISILILEKEQGDWISQVKVAEGVG